MVYVSNYEKMAWEKKNANRHFTASDVICGILDGWRAVVGARRGWMGL